LSEWLCCAGPLSEPSEPIGNVGWVTTLSRWIELDGAVNVRDLGGLPTRDGTVTAPRRLIRSDNLQALTASDVRLLVDELKVRSVVDLRTGVEVVNEGPGPLTREPDVDVRHLSLFPEVGQNTDAAALPEGKSVILPWQERARIGPDGKKQWPDAAEVYVGYLTERPDSVLAGLRLIAATEGATIVHCAAGKDRTGILTALALEEVGVEREAIIEDYVLTGERIEAIMRRLMDTQTYSDDVVTAKMNKHKPKAETMIEVFATVDGTFGGVGTWLREQGWTEADAVALRSRLLA